MECIEVAKKNSIDPIQNVEIVLIPTHVRRRTVKIIIPSIPPRANTHKVIADVLKTSTR